MSRVGNVFTIIICAFLLCACNSFEKKFYKKIDEGQINAIKNGTDTFDLSTITDFEWDSVLLVRGNESVPIFKEQIEEILNSKESRIHWEVRRFNNTIDTTFKWHTTDLPVNKDRFYFLTPNKEIIEKEIESGLCLHKPAFDIDYCFPDSINTYWLSKQECEFKLISNVKTVGDGTVWLIVNCMK